MVHACRNFKIGGKKATKNKLEFFFVINIIIRTPNHIKIIEEITF